jgi:CPA1 family monovalent cation:H+ antiporter
MELAIIIAVAGIGLVVVTTILAPRTGVAAPLLLVLLGIGISFLPFVEAIQIEPEWILGGVLPPLLYAAAVNVPVVEFRRDLRVISGFSVILVVVSAVVVGLAMHMLIPGLGFPLGLALGAIVSPTDAVATSIVRRAGVSPRIVTILEGESLLNDATALVLLRAAVVTVGATVSVWLTLGQFVYSVVVAVLIGWVIGRLNILARSRISHVASNVAVSLTVPFLAYIPAEQLGASGLVAAVVAGLTTGAAAPKALAAEIKVTEAAVWNTVELVLESGVFLLMGLEVFALVEDVVHAHDSISVAVSLAVLAATIVIVLRALFVVGSLWLLHRRERRRAHAQGWLSDVKDKLQDGVIPVAARFEGAKKTARRLRLQPRAHQRWQLMLQRRLADLDYLASERLGRKEGIMLVWAGMRGAVTLAAAQTLPHATPHRSLLVLIAFFVAAGTLLVQGVTLAPLARRLGLTDHALVSSEQAAELRASMIQAAATRLEDPDLRRADGTQYGEDSLAVVRRRLVRLSQPSPDGTDVAAEFIELNLVVLQAERDEVLRLREIGAYPSSFLEDVLRQLDAEQIGLTLRQDLSDL